jgi:methylmalonyl-CoA mutase
MEDKNKQKSLFAEFPPISKERWLEKIHTDLKGADYEKKLVWRFDEQIKLHPFYTADDLQAQNPPLKCASNNDWEIREDADFKKMDEANLYLKRGAEALTLRGFELDTEGAAEHLFEQDFAGKTPIHFVGVYSYPKLLTKLKKASKAKEIDLSTWEGSFDFDYYSYYLFRKEFYHSFEANRRELKNLINKASELLPKYRVINVNAKHYHNAGATMVQEMAFGLAHGAEYLTDCTDEGLSIDDVLPRMQFTFATGSSYFPEIAKIRALRILWQRIVEKFEPTQVVPMYIHSVSSSWNKATFDPHTNLLRTTTECMSAIIGGCDATTISNLDSTFKYEDVTSRRIARNQQIILKEEVNLWKVADVASGSYYIEELTQQLVEEAWKLFVEISEMGGYRAVLENNWLFEQIEKSAAKKDMDLAMRKINLLGVNQFPNLQERKAEVIQIEKRPYKGGLRTYRGAEAFEDLRLKTEAFEKAGNDTPHVFLLTIGDLNMRKARANFAYNFFGVAGFKATDNNGFASMAEGIQAAKNAKADLIVLCSSDEEYPEFLAQVNEMKDRFVVAGYPKGSLEQIQSMGFEHFIHARCNILEELKKYQSILGI